MWDPPKNEDDTPWPSLDSNADSPTAPSEPPTPSTRPDTTLNSSASAGSPPPSMPAPSILDSSPTSSEPTRIIETPTGPPPSAPAPSPMLGGSPASPVPEPVTISAPTSESIASTPASTAPVSTPPAPTPPAAPAPAPTAPTARPLLTPTTETAFSAIGAPPAPPSAVLPPVAAPRPAGAPGIPAAAVQPTVTAAEPPKRRRWPWLLLALGTIAASGLLSWFVAASVQPEPAPAVQSAAEVTTSAPASTTNAAETVDVELLANEPFAAAAEAIRPSVVRLELVNGLGTGVIINSNGTILTAAHVVGDSDTVTVVFADGSRVEGEVVGTHEPTDVGVISVDPDGRQLIPAPLAAGGEVRVGQLAVAVGSPFGFDQTVTAGIISAVDRLVPGSDASFVQTDAPINPGNSGGPLINLQGEVVGINDLIFTESGDNAGVGFAISIDLAIIIADQIVAGVEPQVALLGVSTGPPADGSAGALVDTVGPGTAAEAAGIEVGDVVIAVNGTNTRGSSDLRAQIIDLVPGSDVEITVLRDGEEVALSATLGQTG